MRLPSASARPTILRGASDIDRLLCQSRRLVWSLEPRQIALDLEVLPADEAETLESRLNKLSADCGCRTGSVATTFGALGFIIVLWLRLGSFQDLRPSHAWQGAAALLGSSLVGKVMGIVRSRIKLVEELQRLRVRLVDATP